jgi:hypothetical protein
VGLFSRISRLRNRLEADGVHLLQDIDAVVDANVGGRHVSARTQRADELDRHETTVGGPASPKHTPDSNGGPP